MPPSEDAPRKRARRNFDSDEESSAGEEVQGERKFRFNARKTFLTYAQCPIAPGEFLSLFPLANRVSTCFAKQERHKDGSLHLHAYISFSQKLDLSSPQCFDLVERHQDGDNGGPDAAAPRRFHPNIKRVGGPEDLVRTYEYLCKDGVPPVELAGKIDLYKFSKNFCNVFRDRTSWLNYRRGLSQGPPSWPIQGPNGQVFDNPSNAGKKRNVWLWGPPDSGKTKWLEEKVYCFQNYKVGNNRYPFDLYVDQQIIIYDDLLPKAQHLLVLGNTSAFARPVPGDTRYHQRIIPPGLALWTVVASNLTIAEAFQEETASTIEAIKARFIEIEMLPIVDVD